MGRAIRLVANDVYRLLRTLRAASERGHPKSGQQGDPRSDDDDEQNSPNQVALDELQDGVGLLDDLIVQLK